MTSVPFTFTVPIYFSSTVIVCAAQYVYNAFYQVMMPQYGADPAECYEARFYSYGLFGFLDEWIKRGFYETPEQITELFRKMMERRGYAENGSRCI